MLQHEKFQSGVHPGHYIRKEVLPKGMTVTRAAKLLGVGRPALSNLLNGKAALSENMAVRVERVFDIDSQFLINLQSKYELEQESLKSKIVGVHAPSLVEIKATEIEHWGSSKTVARELLPVLVRRLIHSTGLGLTLVDFPGHEQIQRSGWDGEVMSSVATPWIPEGRSGWEISCQQTISTKAKEDYEKRIESVPLRIRRQMTFVFVTSGNWSDKKSWVEDRNAEENWKEVRVIDASDLEQWLEQSDVDQVWLAEKFDRSIDGFETVEKAWNRWSEASNPKIVPFIFPLGKADFDRFSDWVVAPPEAPFIVSADTSQEALASVCCLINHTSNNCDVPSNRALVLNTTDALERFTEYSAIQPRIAIIHDTALEEKVGGFFRRCHIALAKPNSQIVAMSNLNKKNHVRIGLPSWRRFNQALRDMGIAENKVQKYANESGRSPTVLQRLMSPIARINNPSWCKDTKTARIMLPFALVGIWQRDNPIDLQVIHRLSQTSNDEDLEDKVMEILNMSESPLWSVGNLCGVVSRIDAFFGVCKAMRRVDFERFLEVAFSVLETAHPSMTPTYVNTSTIGLGVHSKMLRKGVRESLSILSVHGNALLNSSLNMNVKQRISSLVNRVLSTLTIGNIKKRMEDLPDLAEAAPEEFLRFVERDFQNQDQSIVLSLLRRSDDDFFNEESKRCHLLWALERLAWKNLGRVAQILARLSSIPIHDNLHDRPINSLLSFYRWYWPQTSATLSERIQSLNTLVQNFPEIGWHVCTAQFRGLPAVAWPTSRPQWRDDATDLEEPTSYDRENFRKNALEQILKWPTDYSWDMLETLLELLPNFCGDHQLKVWRLVKTRIKKEKDDLGIATLRERLRQSVTTSYGWYRLDECEVSPKIIEEAKTLVKCLKPDNLVREHAWLFESFHVELSNHLGQLSSFNYEEEQEAVRKLRADAVKEIWEARGTGGIIDLMKICSVYPTLGQALFDVFPDVQGKLEFLSQYINGESYKNANRDGFIRHFLQSLDEEDLFKLLDSTLLDSDSEQKLWLIGCAPCCERTWSHLNKLDQKSQREYWKTVNFEDSSDCSTEELTLILNNFLEVGRAEDAFTGARRNWKRIDTQRICRILFEYAQLHVAQFAHYSAQGYYIAKAVKEVSRRSDAVPMDILLLEWVFLPVFEREVQARLLLERTLASSPHFFAWILMIRAEMIHELDETTGFTKMLDSKLVSDARSRAFQLLERWSYIPGIKENGNVNEDELIHWIQTVRGMCDPDNLSIDCDRYIGQILARGPADPDGIWPCKAVSTALEETKTALIEESFVWSTILSRGVYGRELGEGGDQERTLSQQYQDWAIERRAEYPFVGSCLQNVANYYDTQAQETDREAELEHRLGI